MTSKFYRRNKFRSKYVLTAGYNWKFKSLVTLDTPRIGVHFLNKIGSRGNFVKVLIARGIGYRVFALANDFVNLVNVSTAFLEKVRPVYSKDAEEMDPTVEINGAAVFDFPYSRYVLIRAGHTRDLVLPLASTEALTSKKDRKLTISSSSAIAAANTAKKIFSYRSPSVYTGRGLRLKHIRPIRKAGKKDKQKGKAF